ncbi:hypothetical protein Dimus_012893, partial [Dionaea muscipula]
RGRRREGYHRRLCPTSSPCSTIRREAMSSAFLHARRYPMLGQPVLGLGRKRESSAMVVELSSAKRGAKLMSSASTSSSTTSRARPCAMLGLGLELVHEWSSAMCHARLRWCIREFDVGLHARSARARP